MGKPNISYFSATQNIPYQTSRFSRLSGTTQGIVDRISSAVPLKPRNSLNGAGSFGYTYATNDFTTLTDSGINFYGTRLVIINNNTLLK